MITRKNFENRLKRSVWVVTYIRLWLESRGNFVKMPSTTMYDIPENIPDHQDEGDLFVQFQDSLDWRRVEIKGMQFPFGMSGYPHKYLCVFNKKRFDEMAELKGYPHMIIYVSNDMQHAGILRITDKQNPDTWKAWMIEDKKRTRQTGIKHEELSYMTYSRNLEIIKLDFDRRD